MMYTMKKIFKRLLSHTLVGALLVTSLVIVPAMSVLAATKATSNGHVYFRKGPGTNYEILIVLMPDAELTLLEKDGEWYKAKYGKKTGYVREDVITIDGEAPTSSSSSSASSGSASYRTLKDGSEGADVLALEQALADLGYLDEIADNEYDEITKAAVRSYQEENGLKADGIAGEDTQTKLLGAPGSNGGGSSLSSSGMLKLGSQGEAVRSLQSALKTLKYYSGSITGSFGPLTKDAVRDFQRAHKLSADGVAGPTTLDAIASKNKVAESSESAPITVAESSSSSMLKLGSQGEAVRSLQTALKNMKFYTGSITGSFGPLTKDAVRDFQRANKLSADGVAGPTTLNAIANRDSGESSSDSSSGASGSSDSGVLKEGSQGDRVLQMQKALKELKYYKGSLTGNFGPLTGEALRKFQYANGLEADGVAGTATLNKLYNEKVVASGGGKTTLSEQTESNASSGSSGGGGTSVSANNVIYANWFDVIRTKYKAGTVVTIYDFRTDLTWRCRFMSNGKHADSEPMTANDTATMYKAFGNKTTWNPKAVWITMPDGKTYIGSLHNTPHLTGSIKDNNFDGHLCIHFPRDMKEAEQTGPYAVEHQEEILKGWDETKRMAK